MRNYLKNSYLDFPYIPEKVILPFNIRDIDMIATWLSKKRRSEVTISVENPSLNKWMSLGYKEMKLLIDNHVKKKNKNRDEMIRGLNELKELMKLNEAPRLLEAFDISSFRGSHPVGSLVVFKDGLPQKSSYRRFRIKGTYEDNNDVAMTGEVTYRRYKRLLDEKGEIPGAVIIDGGKPQLNRVLKVFKSLKIDIPVAGLAKKREELFIPGKSKPILLKGPVKHLLQNLRDEAHRFAITYHKNKRMSSKLVSELDRIPGVGNTRRNSLLQEFGSVANIADASVEDLQRVVPKKIAEQIFIFMKNKKKRI
ncbi:MAG: helix-hairpin-helix domain-containing protein [Candidatus Hodarchaeales archaeon]